MTPLLKRGRKFIPVSRFAFAMLALLPIVTSGCGSSGPDRFEYSGTVTYGGEPVPGGRILFTPNAGNRGVASVAEIVDGKYLTRANKGAIGGPHEVTIFATDGTTATEQHDNTLFSGYTDSVDLPPGGGTIDIDVPKTFTAKR